MKLVQEKFVGRLLIFVLLLVLVMGLSITSCSSLAQPEGSGRPPQVGELAPDFALPNLEGQSISLSNFRGRGVLINFWASWCGPCIYEMPFIQEVDEEWSGKGLQVLAINMRESRSQVLEFIESNSFSFLVLLDEGGKVAERYYIRGIPSNIFIDKEGIIQAMKIGAFPSKEAVEKDLVKIIP